jgi:pyruvate dehydrogenase E2 component (dihydrolipoamide acetyltransferase)
MPIDVIMPKVDMDQETGTVVEWVKGEGEQVTQGEIILVIETDKVAIEVESPGTGILAGISIQPGDTVPIATTIAYILQPDEALPGAAPEAPPPSSSTPQAAPPAAGQNTVATTPVTATPVARNMAASAGLDLANVAGTGPGGKVTRSDIEAALAPSGAPAGYDGKVYATPAARRIAREIGVDLSAVSGSGPKGRIQADDVSAAPPTAVTPVSAPQPLAVPPGQDVEIIPLQGMRRTIAERLTASYQNTPHITFTVRVEMSHFNSVRAELNERAEASGEARISATAILVKAVAMALTRHPMLNSALHGEEIHLHRDVNVGVAVALEQGLIVPVVHNAAQKGVAQIAAEVKDLAGRAREGRLLPADVGGGTFTISNLGPFGVEQFTAIINPPQSAILAVGATQLEAVPDEDGQISARPIMRMTLSADHRVVDGAVAAYFLADLKAVLETPSLLLW